MWYDIFIILLPSLFAFLVLVFSARDKAAAKQADADALPRNAIVVDGSNVLHWGGAPSLKVLSRVLQSLQDKGYAPILFFDANVGYLVSDRYYGEATLAELLPVPERQICVVDRGVIADEAILSFAGDHNLRIVTNDRYRDWRDRFPAANRKGAMLRGDWREGSVVWRGSL